MAFEDKSLRAYNGEEPYIFISYSHKDDKAEEVVRLLIHNGYRVWYDEGIPTATRFHEVIADRIDSCTFFIPLFSDTFLVSEYCTIELDFASSLKRSILPVYLEPVDFSKNKAVKMFYGRVQSVFLYKLSDQAEFLKRVAAAPGIELCCDTSFGENGGTAAPQSSNVEDSGIIELPPVQSAEDDTDDNLIPCSFDVVSPQPPAPPATNITEYTPVSDFIFRNSYNDSAIRKYKGEGLNVVIPYGVTRIDGSAFSYCTSLTSITIPDSVTSIGAKAFNNCTSLTSITIPDSVTSIGADAFCNCTSLTTITIPDSVTSISANDFYNCTNLTSITIPDGVTKIGDSAFNYCTSLTSITIPDSVTSIGDSAFRYCTSLTSITIPDSVTSIGANAFYNCTSLTSITIPDSVTSIGANAFYNCTSLTSITIPDSVTSIGSEVFAHCYALLSIDVHSDNPAYTIEDGVLYTCDMKELLVYPAGKKVSSFTIPETVTSIKASAFCGCSSLTSVTIPKSVTSIGACAFEDCAGLTSVTIPENVIWIGGRAFEGCEELKTVYYNGLRREWIQVIKEGRNPRLKSVAVYLLFHP